MCASQAVALNETDLEQLELEIRSDPIKWAYWKLKDP